MCWGRLLSLAAGGVCGQRVSEALSLWSTPLPCERWWQLNAPLSLLLLRKRQRQRERVCVGETEGGMQTFRFEQRQKWRETVFITHLFPHLSCRNDFTHTLSLCLSLTADLSWPRQRGRGQRKIWWPLQSLREDQPAEEPLPAPSSPCSSAQLHTATETHGCPV